MEGEPFHKSCFKCAHGGCPLTHSSYASLDGVLYCKHHFARLFMEKGNYSHVLEAAQNRKSAPPTPDHSEPPSGDEGEGEGETADDTHSEPPPEAEQPEEEKEEE
ncbi:hypothetical protein L6452_36534 [Arctium lappa]|uniref:Uncharacterized protein n=1 Tax=Arctium lappa TaxID=4217 RepID=A0ACB8YA58_ARCLA|nr:hypothetical protein L6452_36534 [Arctium lappa]